MCACCVLCVLTAHGRMREHTLLKSELLVLATVSPCRLSHCALQFVGRHVGPRDEEIREMAKLVGFDSLDDLIKSTIPDQIRFPAGKDSVLPAPKSETEALSSLRAIAMKNKVRACTLNLCAFSPKLWH